MIKRLLFKLLFLIFCLSLSFAGKTDAVFSDQTTVGGSQFTTGDWVATSSDVVLNEILPNPEGDDFQGGLAGEWVELYNNGDTTVDVTSWYIKDGSASGNQQTISPSTTHNSQTILGAKGSGSEWLVLFMAGQILDNTGDTVTLYTDGDVVVDSYTFSASTTDTDNDSANTPGAPNSTVGEDPGNEGKSYARIPDGTGAWVDPDPTPGGPNRLETENEIEIEPAVEVNEGVEMEEQTKETEPESEPEEVVEEEAVEESGGDEDVADTEVTADEEEVEVEEDLGEEIKEELPPEPEEIPEEEVVEQPPATEPEEEEEAEPEYDSEETDEEQPPATEPPIEIQPEEESSGQTPLPEEENNPDE